MNIPTEESELASLIDQKVDAVLSAYQALLDASDGLANTLGVDHDTILIKVLPVKTSERRSPYKLSYWIETEKPKILKEAKERRETQEREARRELLIDSLNLTDEDKALLFRRAV